MATGRMSLAGWMEVYCCGEECEWRDEHWFHRYVMAVAMGVLNVAGGAEAPPLPAGTRAEPPPGPVGFAQLYM